MAKEFMLNEIKYLNVEYWAEEKNHAELKRCISGSFSTATLYFSGCRTVGEYFDWLKNPENVLEVRYWDEMPSDEERKAPWRVYAVQYESDEMNITEEEFEVLRNKYPLKKVDINENQKSSFREIWKCENPKITAIRPR